MYVRRCVTQLLTPNFHYTHQTLFVRINSSWIINKINKTKCTYNDFRSKFECFFPLENTYSKFDVISPPKSWKPIAKWRKKKRICYGFNNIICFIEFLKPKQFSVWLWIMNYEFWLYRHFLAILAEKFRQEFTDFYWWMLVNQCLRCLSLWICSFRFLVAFDRLFGRASLLDLNLTSVGAFDSRSIWALDRKNAIGWKAGRNVIDFETLW